MLEIKNTSRLRSEPRRAVVNPSRWKKGGDLVHLARVAGGSDLREYVSATSQLHPRNLKEETLKVFNIEGGSETFSRCGAEVQLYNGEILMVNLRVIEVMVKRRRFKLSPLFTIHVKLPPLSFWRKPGNEAGRW